ncbi:SMI1/KNR4 family protein [Dactylosporangium sp. NPDC050688]|uniref:SMI1/KNR4 family protein n=1 Tax=Dactylosporangium sp. NPDC050688 TaxID=3157217 RepID=UPI0033E7F3B7
MEFTEFQVVVEDFLARFASEGNPPEFRALDEVRADDRDLAFVEAQLGVTFPQKYRQVMKTYGGGLFGYVRLLPVRAPQAGDDDVLEENSGPYAVPGFVSVAPVGTGDMYGFVVRDGICEEAVSMWIHDENRICFDTPDFLAFLTLRAIQGGTGGYVAP